jgi:DnaJ-class molecular chaperone
LPHPTFERQGNDLKITIKISLRQALLGFKSEIKHLDGRRVTLNRTGKITNSGQIEKVTGEGMPVYEMSSDRGDLIITYQVELP